VGDSKPYLGELVARRRETGVRNASAWYQAKRVVRDSIFHRQPAGVTTEKLYCRRTSVFYEQRLSSANVGGADVEPIWRGRHERGMLARGIS